MVTVNNSSFKEMLEKVAPAAGNKAVIKLQAKDGRMIGQTSDGACSANSVIAATVDEEMFVAVVDYGDLMNVVSGYARLGDDDISLAADSSLTVSNKNGKVDLPLRDEKDFIEAVPPKGDPLCKAVLDGNKFKAAVDSAMRTIAIKGDESVVNTMYIRFLKDEYQTGGSDGQITSIFRQGVYKTAPEIEDYIEVGITGVRMKGLKSVLGGDEDVLVQVYEKCIMLRKGTSIYVVPLSVRAPKWVFYDVTVQMCRDTADRGASFEVNRKALINSLELISSNLNPTAQKDAFAVVMEVNDNVLRMTNGAKTASTDLVISLDKGTTTVSAKFSINYLKQVLSGLTQENIIISIMADEKSTTLHIEELSEQILLLGIKK